MQRRRTPGLLLAMGLLFAAVPAPAVAQVEGAADDLQARLAEFVGLVPGGAAAVTIRDGVTTVATAGLADATGTPVVPETAFLAGPVLAPIDAAIVLQLADDGLIDLDARLSTYLPDEPVPAEATPRSLMTHTAGLPDVTGTMIQLSLDQPSHVWTDEELIGLVDADASGAVGTFAPPNYTNSVLVRRLIEAASGTAYAEALRTRIAEPLGLDATGVARDATAPSALAAGWVLDLGQTGDHEINGSALRTISPGFTTVDDLATFMQGLLGGGVISDTALATMFDEGVARSGYGFERHDEYLGDISDRPARYFVTGGGSPAGFAVAEAVAPSTGDMVAVLANNIDLDALGFVRETVAAWAAEAPAEAAYQISDAVGTSHVFVNVTCDYGQLTLLELPPCEVGDDGLHLTMVSPSQRSGPLDGFGVFEGVGVLDPGDGTFTYGGRLTFAGDVEGCGSGTVFFEVAGEGFVDETGVSNYTTNVFTAIPGGTLRLDGTIDESGVEVPQGDGTATIEYRASYAC